MAGTRRAIAAPEAMANDALVEEMVGCAAAVVLMMVFSLAEVIAVLLSLVMGTLFSMEIGVSSSLTLGVSSPMRSNVSSLTLDVFSGLDVSPGMLNVSSVRLDVPGLDLTENGSLKAVPSVPAVSTHVGSSPHELFPRPGAGNSSSLRE